MAIEFTGRWIPVDDRLPVEGDLVLVATKSKNGTQNINRAYLLNGTWHGSGSMAGVTHWTDLPPFPEVD